MFRLDHFCSEPSLAINPENDPTSFFLATHSSPPSTAIFLTSSFVKWPMGNRVFCKTD